MDNIEKRIIGLLRKANTSYKYFFLLSCIELAEVDKLEYCFVDLSKAMIAEAFLHGDFVNQRYTKSDRLFDLLGYLIIKDLSFTSEKDFNRLLVMIDENEDDYVDKMIKQFSLYVPYRLIVTDDFSCELHGLPDSMKNKMIQNFSHIFDTIYIINDKSITWNRKYFDYILENKESLIKKISNMIYEKFKRK